MQITSCIEFHASTLPLLLLTHVVIVFSIAVCRNSMKLCGCLVIENRALIGKNK